MAACSFMSDCVCSKDDLQPVAEVKVKETPSIQMCLVHTEWPFKHPQ